MVAWPAQLGIRVRHGPTSAVPRSKAGARQPPRPCSDGRWDSHASVVRHARFRGISRRRRSSRRWMIASMQFLDRRDAGRRLAAELSAFADERPVVVALPRGGVPIACEVASALGAPLDILAVRKLGAPGNPELAVGAVAEDGTGVFDPQSASMLGMTQATFDETLARESQE